MKSALCSSVILGFCLLGIHLGIFAEPVENRDKTSSVSPFANYGESRTSLDTIRASSPLSYLFYDDIWKREFEPESGFLGARGRRDKTDEWTSAFAGPIPSSTPFLPMRFSHLPAKTNMRESSFPGMDNAGSGRPTAGSSSELCHCRTGGQTFYVWLPPESITRHGIPAKILFSLGKKSASPEDIDGFMGARG